MYYRCLLNTIRFWSSSRLLDSEMVKVLSIVSIMIENEYVTFNVQKEKWYFDRDSDNTTIDGFGRTPWFTLSTSLHNLCMERSVNGYVYDTNCPPLPDGQKMKVCKVMHTSIHSLSNRAVKWVFRTSNLYWSLSWHTQWRIVMVHCSVLAPSMWPRTQPHHIP